MTKEEESQDSGPGNSLGLDAEQMSGKEQRVGSGECRGQSTSPQDSI